MNDAIGVELMNIRLLAATIPTLAAVLTAMAAIPTLAAVSTAMASIADFKMTEAMLPTYFS